MRNFVAGGKSEQTMEEERESGFTETTGVMAR